MGPIEAINEMVFLAALLEKLVEKARAGSPEAHELAKEAYEHISTKLADALRVVREESGSATLRKYLDAASEDVGRLLNETVGRTKLPDNIFDYVETLAHVKCEVVAYFIDRWPSPYDTSVVERVKVTDVEVVKDLRGIVVEVTGMSDGLCRYHFYLDDLKCVDFIFLEVNPELRKVIGEALRQALLKARRDRRFFESVARAIG